jgi:hypothetical protein
MQDYKEGLNPEQLAAATSAAPHMVVVAGAGTGKVQTMVACICHLLVFGSPPERIFAIAFMRKAAFSTLILSSTALILWLILMQAKPRDCAHLVGQLLT